ncbi:VOC family protein [Nigerium massiliense]|uniref:VOC family protein n=1 Tax=Nigerium massiliense TaxID=1522317 RepID=UPI00058E2769|nr:VOC family protein [Nigerium massiliense]
MADHPRLRQTVLDATDVRALAEFYRALLGYEYRPGDELPTDGPDDLEWLVLRGPGDSHNLAFQQVDELPPSTWPRDGVPQQLHLDLTVPDAAELERQRRRVEDLGATLLLDRFDDPEEPLYVFGDPAGHPFCIFVG